MFLVEFIKTNLINGRIQNIWTQEEVDKLSLEYKNKGILKSEDVDYISSKIEEYYNHDNDTDSL